MTHIIHSFLRSYIWRNKRSKIYRYNTEVEENYSLFRPLLFSAISCGSTTKILSYSLIAQLARGTFFTALAAKTFVAGDGVIQKKLQD